MTSRRTSFFTLALLLLLPFVAVKACGPDFQPDVFVRTTHPDDLEQFAKGQLGILQGTFDSNDLAVAYRYLNGGKLSEKEQLAYAPPTKPALVTPQQFAAARQAEEAAQPVTQWEQARAKYAAQGGDATQEHSAPQDIGNGNVYYYPDYLNCPDAAFKTAALTLNDRASTWGAQSAYLRDWIGGQDAVFSNCSGKSPTAPVAAPIDSPALLRADRAYQIAATAFYAGKYDDARQQFEAIAHDQSSPWHIWGQYLAARALVRLAYSQGKKTDPWSGDLATFNPETMRSAQQMLQMLLEEHDPAIPRQAIVNELNFVRMRTEPDQRIAEIDAALAGPAPDPNFRQDLDDLSYAFYKKIPITEPPPLYAWIVAFRTPAAGTSVFTTWQQSHALPWLVAALTLATPQDRGVADLLAAASRIEPASPAFQTVAFHRIRLLIGLDHADESRSPLDGILPGLRKQKPDSALNAFTGERMQVARNFEEFLTYAPRTLLETNTEGAGAFLENSGQSKQEIPPLQFDEDSVAILNRQTPLRLLVEATSSMKLPANLRQDVTLAAWVRSVVLDDKASATALAQHLPESIRKVSGTSTGFPAVLAILQNPGLRPYLEPGVSRLASYSYRDPFRDNWWCHNWQTQYYTSEQQRQKLNEPKPVSFLSADEQKTAEAEYQRLMQLPCAPTDLGQRILDYAKSHPSDPNVPEALALTVRATHFGSNEWSPDKDAVAWNSAVCKAAFQLLHQRYPQSPWTAQTPYYY